MRFKKGLREVRRGGWEGEGKEQVMATPGRGIQGVSTTLKYVEEDDTRAGGREEESKRRQRANGRDDLWILIS